MRSSIPDLHYERLTADTLALAFALKRQTWPNDIHPEDFAYKVADSCDRSNRTWLIYYGQILVGMLGVFTFDPDEPGYDDGESIWLDWFTILPEYRGRGWGRAALNDAICYCRSLGSYHFLRLDTDYSPERPSIRLYDSVMDLGEPYTAEDTPAETHNYRIYTLCPDSTPLKPWRYHPRLPLGRPA